MSVDTESRTVPHKHKRARAGFTLFEILIAVAILAVTLAVIIQSISADLRGIDRNRAHTIGLMHAQSKMAEVSAWSELRPGQWHGTFEDQFRWQIEVTPSSGGELGGSVKNNAMLLKITVRTLLSNGDAIVELSSHRIGYN